MKKTLGHSAGHIASALACVNGGATAPELAKMVGLSYEYTRKILNHRRGLFHKVGTRKIPRGRPLAVWALRR